MPVFISDEELRRSDVTAVVGKAEEYVRDFLVQIETQKARADAAVINAEQTCALVEQKYVALLAQVSQLEGDKAQVVLSLEAKSSEYTQAQAHIQQLELQQMQRDGEQGRQSCELQELHKARKELLDVVEKKNLELDEKNATSRTYLERILALTEERSNLESRIHEQMGEVTHLRALEARLSQEKEITSQHNSWLNQELQAKVSTLLEERQRNAYVEAELQARVAEAERSSKEKEDAYRRSQDRVKELEAELRGMIEELRFVKEDAAAKEEHLSTEVATASKLADLYKKSSDEWSRKVNDLEGVIKALEVHLNQTTSEFEGKLRQEVEAREAREKEFSEAKENFEKKIVELQQTKNSDRGFLQIESRSDDPATQLHENAITLPNFPYGVSGTALAATLLRDGWTLGTVYSKYQEAVDAWRHERHERNRSQALLEKVLREIESKGARIMEERAEYTKMLDSYVIMEEKLNLSLSDQAHLENAVRDSKAELRRKERELKGALKDVSDLQTQVSILLKECMDIQKRHGIGGDAAAESCLITSPVPDVNSSDALISEKLVCFKDIHGMVEHNTQLRALVRVLAEENERKDTEMKEEFESRLQLRINEAADKVKLVLKKAEEQNAVIERLQGTVGMFKRLYEEERMRTSAITSGTPVPDIIERDSRRLELEVSQDEVRRQLKDATDQIRRLEEELSQSRHNLVAARGDSGRAEAEAAFAKEKLSSLTRESENQRKQMEVILQKNMEASQTITDYQRRLRENYQSVQNAEEQARRLSIQVSFLEREKELLLSAEQRSALEVSQLSDRVHRLQATLDTIETAAEVREVSRAEERRKLEKDMNRMQKEWVDAKHQLELERNLGRQITTGRDKAVERIESLSLELKAALAALSASELRAKVAETRCGELEANLKRADEKIMVALAGGKKVFVPEETDTEILSTLQQSREEIEFLREELKASKMHAEQYKHIANANEEALKRMEEGHLRSKEEAAKTKDVMDSELKLLQRYLMDVETNSLEKEKETGLLQASREALLRDTLIEVAALKEVETSKQVAIQQAEERIAVLREDVEKQHKQWRQAQDNYERQVMLQAETLRELSLVNEKAASLELQETKLRARVEKAEAELESVKVAFYMEKSALQASTVDLEKRLEDLDSQNHLLLDRLEAKHINLAEQERKASGTENNEESTLQSVIHYLRRAKEGAETEVSLLKQERTRLSKQFEAASRAAEEAQEKLRCHHETIRASIFTDEEFRALQSQIMEMNLLREKHGEVREENKKLAEENKGLRERLGKLEEEHEIVKRSAREKHAELEANGGEIQTLKTEVRRWQQRVTQVVQKYKSLDVDDYERTKVSLVEVQERVKQFENELQLARKDAAESRESMLKHEQEASMKTENLAELERRLQEALLSEVSAKAELDKLRKINNQYKRKLEQASREKESVSKELEDHKAGRKFVLEAVHQEALETSRKEAALRVEESLRDTARSEQTLRELDQRMKEKEARIQSLEKTLEKERDEKNKEKGKREKDRKTYLENAAKCSADMNALKQEVNSLKQEVSNLQQEVSNLQQEKEQLMAGIDPARSDPTPTNAEADDQSAELPLRSEGELRLTNTAVSEPVLPPAVEVPVTGALSIMKPPPLKRITGPPSSSDAAEKEREIQELRATISEKERFQTRRSGRRLVRPRIEPSSQADSAVEAAEPLVDMSAEGDAEAPNVSDTAETDNIPSHKRSSSESMEPDQTAMNQDANVPPQKRARSNNIVETQDVGTPETVEPQEKVTGEEEQKPVEFSFDNADADPAKRVRFSFVEDQELVEGRARASTFAGPAGPAEVAVEDMLRAEDAAGAAGTDNLEGEVTEADVQGDEMQTDQGDGAITDTEDFVLDVEDGEIGTGEELEVEQEAQGEQESEEHLAKDVTNPAQAEETCDAQLVEASGSGLDVATSTMDTEKVTEKAGGEAASSAPPSASASAAAAPPSSTTINLTDRARERAAQRRSMYQSPPSPRSRTRGRGRVVRGRGGGRT